LSLASAETSKAAGPEDRSTTLGSSREVRLGASVSAELKKGTFLLIWVIWMKGLSDYYPLISLFDEIKEGHKTDHPAPIVNPEPAHNLLAHHNYP
jgi:hypothetical protein